MNFKSIFLYIFQLPQHLLALLLIPILRAQRGDIFTLYGTQKPATLYFIPSRFYFSLGDYIFLYKNFVPNLNPIIRHEFGHTLQSRKYGPLYLLIVGIPSFFFASLTKLGFLSPSTYHQRFPENEADFLGEVTRSNLK
jgi:hypothetical protein